MCAPLGTETLHPSRMYCAGCSVEFCKRIKEQQFSCSESEVLSEGPEKLRATAVWSALHSIQLRCTRYKDVHCKHILPVIVKSSGICVNMLQSPILIPTTRIPGFRTSWSYSHSLGTPPLHTHHSTWAHTCRTPQTQLTWAPRDMLHLERKW